MAERFPRERLLIPTGVFKDAECVAVFPLFLEAPLASEDVAVEAWPAAEHQNGWSAPAGIQVFTHTLEFSIRRVDKPQAATKGRSLDHVGFEVKGLEAFCKKLEAAGVPFDTAFRDIPSIGLKVAFVVDPAGTRTS
jgi:hypothetical protein